MVSPGISAASGPCQRWRLLALDYHSRGACGGGGGQLNWPCRARPLRAHGAISMLTLEKQKPHPPLPPLDPIHASESTNHVRLFLDFNPPSKSPLLFQSASSPLHPVAFCRSFYPSGLPFLPLGLITSLASVNPLPPFFPVPSPSLALPGT